MKKLLYLLAICIQMSFLSFIVDAQTVYKVTIETLSIEIDSKESVKFITPEHKAIVRFKLTTNAEHLEIRHLGIFIDDYNVESSILASKNDWSLSIVIPKKLGDNGGYLKDGLHKLSLKVRLTAPDFKETGVNSVKTIDFLIGESNVENGLSNKDNSTAKIELEKNNLTGIPYDGLAADGIGSIRIEISGITGSRIKFNIPYGLGNLKYVGGIKAPNEPNIDQYINVTNGSATVFYHPPKYIDAAELKNNLDLNGRQVYYATVPIIFNYEDSQGSKETKSIIKIFRPKVVLVHGFTGDASTWALLAQRLNSTRFDNMSENYYALNDNPGIFKQQDVFAQSRKLSEDISKSKMEYLQVGIKMLKVDVVSHSMGGLIARYYVNGYNAYSNDVRKLFMVGTPNHGIGNIKHLLGTGGALASFSHFGMLDDVMETSPFMQQLNSKEENGGHLNPDVEYYNIYGTVDDGVTNEASAYMPGVQYSRLRDCCHSPSPSFLTSLGTPLTVHPEVFAKVTEYLQKEIGRLPLKNIKANIISVKGDVWVDDLSQDKRVQNTPYKINPYDKIRVLQNSALIIAFTLDGKEWGRILTGQETSLQMRNFSPQLFSVRVVKGKAKFKSENPSHFQADIMPNSYNKREWFTFNPIVDVNGLGTTFDVVYESGIARVNLIEGEIRLDDHNAGKFINFSTPQTFVYAENGNVAVQPLQSENELEEQNFSQITNSLFINIIAGGLIVDAATLVGGGTPSIQPDGNIPNSTAANCLGQLRLQYIQKTGYSSDPQAQAAMRQIDNENRREQYFFNQAEENFKKGVLPKEISGTYSQQQNKSPFTREYYCETIILFKPMKVIKAVGNSSGFKLVKDMTDFKKNGVYQEAVGMVLPCGSYKIFPNSDIPNASAKLTLGEIE